MSHAFSILWRSKLFSWQILKYFLYIQYNIYLLNNIYFTVLLSVHTNHIITQLCKFYFSVWFKEQKIIPSPFLIPV